VRAVLGIMGAEDLGCYRLAIAKLQSIETKPEAYGKEEIESAFTNLWRVQQDVLKAVVVPEGQDWALCHVTGQVGVD